MADRRRVVQVLNNLFANAARHAPESTPIRVAAELESAHVAVSVSDEGRGVTPELLPLVGASQLANQPADGIGSIGDHAEAADLAGGFGNRDRDGGGVDIEPDESYIAHGPALLSRAALHRVRFRPQGNPRPAKRRSVLPVCSGHARSRSTSCVHGD